MHRRAVIAGLVGIPGCLRLESETPPEDEATPPSAESEQDDLTALPELALDEHWTLELPYEDDPPMDRDIHPEWEWAVLAEETGFVIGDDDGHLIRIDMTTGERVWERRLESGLDDRHSLSYHPGTDTLPVPRMMGPYTSVRGLMDRPDGPPRFPIWRRLPLSRRLIDCSCRGAALRLKTNQPSRHLIHTPGRLNGHLPVRRFLIMMNHDRLLPS